MAVEAYDESIRFLEKVKLCLSVSWNEPIAKHLRGSMALIRAWKAIRSGHTEKALEIVLRGIDITAPEHHSVQPTKLHLELRILYARLIEGANSDAASMELLQVIETASDVGLVIIAAEATLHNSIIQVAQYPEHAASSLLSVASLAKTARMQYYPAIEHLIRSII